MGSSSLRVYGRPRLLAFAIVGNIVPILIATATDRSAHHPLFYIGALMGCVASAVAAMVAGRRRLIFCLAAFVELPALTLMQAYTGGAASGYSVLVIIAMLWFGLVGSDLEMLAGLGVLAACCALPMVVVGPPAYPFSWGHAALLALAGTMVAVSLR